MALEHASVSRRTKWRFPRGSRQAVHKWCDATLYIERTGKVRRRGMEIYKGAREDIWCIYIDRVLEKSHHQFWISEASKELATTVSLLVCFCSGNMRSDICTCVFVSYAHSQCIIWPFITEHSSCVFLCDLAQIVDTGNDKVIWSYTLYMRKVRKLHTKRCEPLVWLNCILNRINPDISVSRLKVFPTVQTFNRLWEQVLTFCVFAHYMA